MSDFYALFLSPAFVCTPLNRRDRALRRNAVLDHASQHHNLARATAASPEAVQPIGAPSTPSLARPRSRIGDRRRGRLRSPMACDPPLRLSTVQPARIRPSSRRFPRRHQSLAPSAVRLRCGSVRGRLQIRTNALRLQILALSPGRRLRTERVKAMLRHLAAIRQVTTQPSQLPCFHPHFPRI